MFRALEELIYAYFARIWPIAACKNSRKGLMVDSDGADNRLRQRLLMVPIRKTR